MSRTPLIAGNWKANHGGGSGCKLAATVGAGVAGILGVDIVVAPPFTALAAVAEVLRDTGVQVAAQNLYPRDNGAFTGEVTAPMLVEAGCHWVIVGHSERRQLFGETNEQVAAKVAAALKAGLRPIVCVGETLEEREAGRTLEVVFQQLDAFSAELQAKPGSAVVAYEPVWAIGTGRVAGPEQAQEVHAALRDRLKGLGEGVAELTRLLYGGSVKASNAEGLLSQKDVDGALVGGASLDAAEFIGIIRAARG